MLSFQTSCGVGCRLVGGARIVFPYKEANPCRFELFPEHSRGVPLQSYQGHPPCLVEVLFVALFVRSSGTCELALVVFEPPVIGL
jgi:hypothetical protein